MPDTLLMLVLLPCCLHQGCALGLSCKRVQGWKHLQSLLATPPPCSPLSHIKLGLAMSCSQNTPSFVPLASDVLNDLQKRHGCTGTQSSHSGPVRGVCAMWGSGRGAPSCHCRHLRGLCAAVLPVPIRQCFSWHLSGQ